MADKKVVHYGLAMGASLFVDHETLETLSGDQTVAIINGQMTAAQSSAIRAGGLVEVKPVADKAPDKAPDK